MATTISGSTGISTQSVTTDSGAFYDGLQSGTAVTVSGTSVDFTGIPSWVKRITVMFNSVSTSGTSAIQVQLGDSGGLENTGYLGAYSVIGNSSGITANFNSGLVITASAASQVLQGLATICNLTGNVWMYNFVGGISSTNNTVWAGGSKTLSATLDRIRITTVNGTDTFDAGTINIIYE